MEEEEEEEEKEGEREEQESGYIPYGGVWMFFGSD